jgi:hypothetical protein
MSASICYGRSSDRVVCICFTQALYRLGVNPRRWITTSKYNDWIDRFGKVWV